MTKGRDGGNTVPSDRNDRRATEESRARRDVLIVATIFFGVLLINGLLALLMIVWLESIGWSAGMAVEWIEEGTGWRRMPIT